MHPLRILDQSQDKVALLKGASPNSAAVIAAEPLLIDSSAGECEFALLVEQIQGVLAIGLVCRLDVIGDSRRIVLNVGRHDSFSTVHHEEQRVAS